MYLTYFIKDSSRGNLQLKLLLLFILGIRKISQPWEWNDVIRIRFCSFTHLSDPTIRLCFQWEYMSVPILSEFVEDGISKVYECLLAKDEHKLVGYSVFFPGYTSSFVWSLNNLRPVVFYYVIYLVTFIFRNCLAMERTYF